MRFATIFAGAVLLLGACATMESGSAINFSAVEAFKEGETTRQQVETELGRPQSVTTTGDGGSMLIYTHMVSSANFVGGGQATANSAAFVFDVAGVLKQKTLQNINSKSGMK